MKTTGSAKRIMRLAATGLIFLAADTGSLMADETEGPLPLSLEKAIEMALESDEVLRQASEEVNGAEAGLKEAQSGRFPTLTISGQYGRNIKKPVLFLPSDMGDAFGGVTKIELGEDNDFTTSAVLAYDLWTAGRLSAGIRASGEIVRAMKYQETATLELVRYNVKEAYYGALLMSETLDISRKALRETEEAVRVTRAGFGQGTVSRFELLRAEVELENRKPQLTHAQNAYDQAIIVLKRRTGLDPETHVALTDSLAAVEVAGSLDGYLSMMLQSSAQIKALEHQVAAVRQNLAFERAQRYPLLQLGAYYMVQGQWSEEFLPGKNNLARSAAVTLGFQIPIFDGLKTKARINRARAELRSAEVELERVRSEKEMAVRVAWLAVESAVTALDGRKRAVDLAEETHRLALVRLENGLATPLERLDAELAMTMARAQLAEALYACGIARAQLDLAAGIDENGYPLTAKENGHE